MESPLILDPGDSPHGFFMRMILGVLIITMAAKLGWDALVALIKGTYDTERYSWLMMVGVMFLALFTASIGLAIMEG